MCDCDIMVINGDVASFWKAVAVFIHKYQYELLKFIVQPEPHTFETETPPQITM